MADTYTDTAPGKSSVYPPRKGRKRGKNGPKSPHNHPKFHLRDSMRQAQKVRSPTGAHRCNQSRRAAREWCLLGGQESPSANEFRQQCPKCHRFEGQRPNEGQSDKSDRGKIPRLTTPTNQSRLPSKFSIRYNHLQSADKTRRWTMPKSMKIRLHHGESNWRPYFSQ